MMEEAFSMCLGGRGFAIKFTVRYTIRVGGSEAVKRK